MQFSRFLQVCTVSVLVSTISLAPATPAQAQSHELRDVFRRIDLAGRQRMFSQRMSKAACFVATGVDVVNQQTELASTYAMFDRTNAALSHGDAELGLALLRVSPPVTVALHAVDKRWAEFSLLAGHVIDGGIIDVSGLSELNESGLALLKYTNKAVKKITEVYASDLENYPLIMATTIDLVGRQRMYTQRLSKDLCLIDAGVDVESNTADLAETLEFFNGSLNALIEGIEGFVLPAPTEEIHAKLLEVAELWEAPSAILSAAVGGAEISDQDMLAIATDVERVLAAMNEAALMYEYLLLAPHS